MPDQTITLPVQGMTCAACVRTVEKGVSRTDGVESCQVNFAAETATVTYDPAKVKPEGLVAAVRGVGYDVPVAKTTLAVSGMTCAACVRTVEIALKRVPGVLAAAVNFAAETASVDYVPGQVTLADLTQAVAAAGYGARPAAEVGDFAVGEDVVEAEHRRELAVLQRKLVFSVARRRACSCWACSATCSAGCGCRRPWPIPGSSWLLATPVQFWAGAQFYRGAIGAARHRTTNMSTLIAVGTSAAYFFSVLAVLVPSFFGRWRRWNVGFGRRDGRHGDDRPSTSTPRPWSSP